MKNLDQYKGHTPTWCPGCGDWGISLSIKKALASLGMEPSHVNILFDIGCSGNMNDFLNAYAMHTLHGRAIATAVGVKLADHTTPVLVIGGDGGLYGEGGNHFLHACRGNHDTTVLVHDNSVYGLTTGQVAPTSNKGMRSKSTPQGIVEVPVNPLALAISQGATFVANAFAGDTDHLVQLIAEGVTHKGFSLINVLQPCVTFNKINTYQYYGARSYKLEEGYDPTDFKAAVGRALEMSEERYPLGVLYKVNRPSYHEQLTQISPDVTLVERPNFKDFSALIQDYY